MRRQCVVVRSSKAQRNPISRLQSANAPAPGEARKSLARAAERGTRRRSLRPSSRLSLQRSRQLESRPLRPRRTCRAYLPGRAAPFRVREKRFTRAAQRRRWPYGMISVTVIWMGDAIVYAADREPTRLLLAL
jgi:hypothetical protein